MPTGAHDDTESDMRTEDSSSYIFTRMSVAALLSVFSRTFKIIHPCLVAAQFSSNRGGIVPGAATGALVSLASEMSSRRDAFLREMHRDQSTNAETVRPSTPPCVAAAADSTMETILLAIQGARNKYNAHLNRDVNNENRSVDVYSSEINIVQHHSLCRKAVHQLRLSEINERAALLFRAIDAHVNVIGATSTIESHIAVASAAAALLPFVTTVWKIGGRLLIGSILFHDSVSRLTFIVLRIFRALCENGFCRQIDAKQASEARSGSHNDQDEESKDGVGMGTGFGEVDVTKTISHEEQLLGLDESDINIENDRASGHDSVANEGGMEMEHAFAGTEEVSQEQPLNASDADHDNSSIDHEFDVSDAVDELMWGEGVDESTRPNAGGDDMPLDKHKRGSQSDAKYGDDQRGCDISSPIKASTPENERRAASPSCEQESVRTEGHAASMEGEQRNDVSDVVALGQSGDGATTEDGLGVQEEETCNALGAEPTVVDDLAEEEEGSVHGEVEEVADLRGDIGDGARESECEGQRDSDEVGFGNIHPIAGQDGDGDKANSGEVGRNPTEECLHEDETRGAEGRHAADSGMEADAAQGKSRRASPVAAAPNVPPDVSDATTGAKGGVTKTTNDKPGVDMPTPPRIYSYEHSPDSRIAEGETGKADVGVDCAPCMPDPHWMLGDVEKYWHRRLELIQRDNRRDTVGISTSSQMLNNHDCGAFEFVGENDRSSVSGNDQMLAPLNENTNAHCLKEMEVRSGKIDTSLPEDSFTMESNDGKSSPSGAQTVGDSVLYELNDRSIALSRQQTIDNVFTTNAVSQKAEKAVRAGCSSDSRRVGDTDKDSRSENAVANTRAAAMSPRASPSNRDASTFGLAHGLWRQYCASTNELSLRLCEQLRLLLAPLVAAKLRGDFSTGKRINMRKVISYVASQFKNDKIWLRRTKPSKRLYQVMVAIDDSESMSQKLDCTGAGHVACEALALITNAMVKLDVGEVAIASFGSESVQLLHDFGAPFNHDAGAEVLRRFTFSQKWTNWGRSLENIIGIFDSARRRVGARLGGQRRQTMQLLFVISDGRIDSDREAAHYWTRIAIQRGILPVLLVCDGSIHHHIDRFEHPANMPDSISQLVQWIKTENGNLIPQPYLQAYPFPYYLLVRNIKGLPEVLADALRQWFELINQSNRRRA